MFLPAGVESGGRPSKMRKYSLPHDFSLIKNLTLKPLIKIFNVQMTFFEKRENGGNSVSRERIP
jgi:hypothetical protein